MKSNSDVPWFWNEAVWLPKNMSWTDFKSSGDERYPSSGDLWIPIVLSLLLMVCRRWIEIRLIYPIGLSRGMKPRPKLQDLPMPRELAVSLQRNGLVTATQVPTLAKRCDLPETVVAKWVHEVERRKRPGKLEKLGETGWRSLAYLSLFSLGIFALWDKPHFSDTRECWVGYPKHSIPMAIYWYYMIELSFYWSLLFFQFLDTRRKDFWQMLVHHVVTISLIVFSWITNFHRIGTLIMLLHDCADVFLDKRAREPGKPKGKRKRVKKRLPMSVKCNDCGAICVSSYQLRRHLISVHKTSYYNCPACDRQFSMWRMMKMEADQAQCCMVCQVPVRSQRRALEIRSAAELPISEESCQEIFSFHFDDELVLPWNQEGKNIICHACHKLLEAYERVKRELLDIREKIQSKWFPETKVLLKTEGVENHAEDTKESETSHSSLNFKSTDLSDITIEMDSDVQLEFDVLDVEGYCWFGSKVRKWQTGHRSSTVLLKHS
ncbi:unnamed protein product [Cyprideis torosa]|uniref:Uncharacterized protein n=1 Tax=Cyprideis torosa TaxID=163714 RepID=A0A7R8ZS68_9CRUS|nr:unnamed protein product [Cyprideis torosa]CAG0895516.1 unnamed protein product [Cyprideis torosa]